jgi:cyclophilin family peptidyl-prolyl cis-trans isomerase
MESCLVVGRGKVFNELGMTIKDDFENCTFLSLHEAEGPDIVGKFEDLKSDVMYDNIYFDMYVQQFLIYTGTPGKGISVENNKLVRESLLRNLSVGGTVYFPASENVKKNFTLQLNMAKSFKSIAQDDFKIKRPKGTFPLFEKPDLIVPQAGFYYTMTRLK